MSFLRPTVRFYTSGFKMKYTPIIITSLTLVIMLTHIILPDREFSENENRILQQLPEMSKRELLNGDFSEKTSSYLADQFPFRDGILSAKTTFEKATFHSLINNVFIGKDGYRIENYSPSDCTRTVAKNVNTLVDATKAKVELMLVPTAIESLSDKTPVFSEGVHPSQLEDLNNIYSLSNADNISSHIAALKKSDRKTYYRTDHHWTSEGAYLGYLAFCRENEIEPQPESAFDIKTVTQCFKGTIYSKLNEGGETGEQIKAYLKDEELEIKYDSKSSNSLYNYDYLEKKDKYSFFLDNIHTLVQIKNKNAQSDKTLVVIKDSYANCFIPFLTAHYKYIYVIDPRSFTDSLTEFINEKKADTVLVLYNMNTLSEDTGMMGEWF